MSKFAPSRRTIAIALILIGTPFVTMASSDNSVGYGDYLTRTQLTHPPLELANHEGDCMIRVGSGGQWQAVGIAAPCGFVRRGSPEAQSYFYEGIGRVFLIAGPVKDGSPYQNGQGKSPDDVTKKQCSDEGRPVIFSEGELIFRAKRGISGVEEICHEGGPDKKNFYMYAHPPGRDAGE